LLKISSVTISNNPAPIGKLTILVGPNNVGKSQFLRDILSFMSSRDAKRVLLKDISFQSTDDFKSFTSNIMVSENPQEMAYYKVGGLDPTLLKGTTRPVPRGIIEGDFNIDTALANLGIFKVAYLDASSRLNMSMTASSSPSDGAPQNPLQGLYRIGKSTQLEIQDIFKRAFSMDIRLDYSELYIMRFRVSKNFPSIPADPQEALHILKSYPVLDEQGDGFKSFVGIIGGFLLSKERVVLLDEPEAFLHPKQCKILGSWITAYSATTDNQVIISTHNGNFLTGILSANANVDVFRMNRRGDTTELILLSSENLQKLSNSPLLSGQPIFESLFHEGVVVCEGDADRCLYQTVAAKHLNNDSIFFVHSHSKQNIKEVVRLMRTSGIPVAAIVDIDILNSAEDLQRLLSALNPGKDHKEILSARESIAKEIEGKTDTVILGEVLTDLKGLVSDLQNNKISLSGTRNRLQSIRKGASNWNDIKSQGVSVLGKTQQATAIHLIESCKSHGLFIVQRGELESWMDLGIGKQNKAKWIVKAMQSLNAKCPKDLSDFVNEVLIYLRN
jgi:ABC-type cobalamin/Fe3+-siderophores transport system ATPase subunit